MKIAIGHKLISSSWGGGNQFVSSLVKSSQKKGHEITFDLKDSDIDIILLTDPRSYNAGTTFGSLETILYLIFRNKKALVVHRINECDERKKTHHLNMLLKLANYSADYTVFIASWLRNLDLWQKYKPSKVILNGGDKDIFKNYTNNFWDGISPLKIITHHWSPNIMKGFSVYKKLDDLISLSEWKNKIEFTFIGNLPKGFKFINSKHISPMNGHELGRELSKHHLYISASINEPAGMHHIEGILCGLPIIYRNSGALPEYCKDYGISFENQDFVPALKEIIKDYPKFKKNIIYYPHNSERMTDEYLNLFSQLIKNRKHIIKKRNLFKSPFLLLSNLIFLLLQLKNIVKLKHYKKFFNKL